MGTDVWRCGAERESSFRNRQVLWLRHDNENQRDGMIRESCAAHTNSFEKHIGELP